MKFSLNRSLIYFFPLVFLLVFALSPLESKGFFFIPFLLMAFYVFISNLIVRNQFKKAFVSEAFVEIKTRYKFFISIVMIVLVDDMVRYYTGMGVLEAYVNLLEGNSNYNLYQLFFRENERASFEIIKIYYNLLLMVVKLSAFYGLYLIFFAPKKSIFNFFLITPLISYSLTRGTNLEFLELFLFTITLTFVKFNHISNRSKVYLFLIFTIFIFIVSSVFLYQVQLRYGMEYLPGGCNYDFCYSHNSYLSDLFNMFLFVLTPYLMGGVYNLHVYISEFSFFMVFPLNTLVFETELSLICKANEYSCGPWKTLPILVVENFGYIFAIVFYIGIPFLLRSFIRHSSSLFISMLALYSFVYFIFSSFNGDGVISSFSNIFMLLTLVLFYVFRVLRYK